MLPQLLMTAKPVAAAGPLRKDAGHDMNGPAHLVATPCPSTRVTLVGCRTLHFIAVSASLCAVVLMRLQFIFFGHSSRRRLRQPMAADGEFMLLNKFGVSGAPDAYQLQDG